MCVCVCVCVCVFVCCGISPPVQLVCDGAAMATEESHHSQNVCYQTCRHDCPSVHLFFWVLFISLCSSVYFCLCDDLLIWDLLICPSVDPSSPSVSPLDQSSCSSGRLFIDPCSACRSISLSVHLQCFASLANLVVQIPIHLSICLSDLQCCDTLCVLLSLTLKRIITEHQQEEGRHKWERNREKEDHYYHKINVQPSLVTITLYKRNRKHLIMD